MSGFTEKIFATAEMSTIFSAEETMRIMLDFELGLVHSLAENKIISAKSYGAIQQAISEISLDTEVIAKRAMLAGNPAIPFVNMLTEAIEEIDKDAASWIHYGATSQDLIDSTLMVQLKSSCSYLLEKLAIFENKIATLCEKHKDTPMIGRTLLQQAKPITFGYKAAGWLNDVLVLRHEIEELLLEGFPVQLGGAVGTLSSFGTKGESVSEALAKFLSLNTAETPWHTHRRPFMKIAQLLTELALILGKIGKDIILLMQTEIAELYEGVEEGKGGSSAMPHKRNPVNATFLLAIAEKAPGVYQTLLTGSIHEHERAAGAWHSEWGQLENLCQLADATLCYGINLFNGLVVDTERMYENLMMMHGVVFSEDVTLALAVVVGKSKAKQLVAQACEEAISTGRPLNSILMDSNLLSEQELDVLFDLNRATGLSVHFVDKILKKILN